MGFHYTDRVFKYVKGTKGSEQLVLLALAHCADDKTGKCYPSLETLAKRTHLHRSTVIRNLDVLKKMRFITWESGGRKKKGCALSNLYKLTIPKKTVKQEEDAVSESWDDVDNSQDMVAQCDPYPSHSATTNSRTARPQPVAQRDPIINKSIIYHPDDHHPPPEAAGGMPGRFEFGVARRDGTLNDVLERVDDAKVEIKRAEVQDGPLQLALKAVGRENSIEDKKAFSNVMLTKNYNDLLEEIYRFDSERRAGEMKNIKNLAALLMARLQALPDA